jgi:WD40 repeat protein
MNGHTDSVMGVIVPKEEQNIIVSGSLDKTIRVWSLKDGSALRVIKTNMMIVMMKYF